MVTVRAKLCLAMRSFVCGSTALALMAFTSVANAQPTFSKLFNPSTIGPGGVSTLQFDIMNPRSLPATNASFSDTLPAGVTIATPANAVTTCDGTLTAPDGGTTISFSTRGIPGNDICSITVDVTSSAPGTHTNVSGDLISGAGNSGSATADLVVATDRPGFSKSFAPSSINLGGRSALTFTIDNTANPNPAFNLNFSDSLPLGVEIAGPANASTTCSDGTLSAPAGDSVISYNTNFSIQTPSVTAFSSCTVSVDVVATGIGTHKNVSGELTSSATVGGSARSSGTASATLQVTASPLSLTKSFTNDPVHPGGSVDLEFTVTNGDRSSTANNISFDDDLGATLLGLVATDLPLNDVCGTGSQLSGSSVISLTGGTLAPEASCTFGVSLQVPAEASPGQYPNTTSTITSDSGSGVAATDTLFVNNAPSLTKTFLFDAVGAGETVSIEFTITNTSTTAAATDIAFLDNLSAFISATTVTSLPDADFCGAGSSITTVLIGGELNLSMTGGSLAASGFCTFTVDLQIPEGTGAGISINTTGNVTATVGGIALTGNPATDDLTVAQAPTLTKSFSNDPVAPGGTVTLEFTLVYDVEDENAPDATGITFTDDLTTTLAGLAVASGGLPSAPCGAGSSLTGNTLLTLTGGTLSAGDSCTFSVTLAVPATALPGSHPNTTSNIMATVSGATVTGEPGEADLQVSGLTLTKEFTDDPVIPGDTLTLQFTLDNTSSSVDATDIVFSDDLSGVFSGLVVSGSLPTTPCGTGSSITGTNFLTFTGGNLLAGASCSFEVTLQVPASAASGTFANTTSAVTATVSSSPVSLDPAADGLVVSSDLLLLAKSFTDDPVSPGDTVTLQFTLTNLDTLNSATAIAFTDDLDAALSGLASTSGPLTDVCGSGSQISGTSLLTFTGGNLAPGTACTFEVSLSVPTETELGSVATNTTSQVTGTINGLAVTGDPSLDNLLIDSLILTKEFTGDPVNPGDTVNLRFTIENLNTSDAVANLSFQDDLSAALSGLVATGLPASNVCGAESVLTGTSFLTLTDASLLAGGTCTIDVSLQVPAAAAPGNSFNVTSQLQQFGIGVGQAASDTLQVVAVVDADGDGVLDGDDVCPGTVIPEGVPTQSLGNNRYALVDADLVFDKGSENGPNDVFTTTDTAGCSCEQIIEEQGLGQGHTKFGCSIGAMRDWVDLVNP